MTDLAPWELVSEGPGALHLRLYAGGGWAIFAGLFLYGAWWIRRAFKGERRGRAGRLVPGVAIALLGAGFPFVMVRNVNVRLENGVLSWTETRPPGRITRRGELRAADVADVVVTEKPGRFGPSYRPVLRAKDGTEHLPDEQGQSRPAAEALADRIRGALKLTR